MKANQKLKTLGPRAAHLIAELHERQKTIFTNKDVEKISGLGPKSARGVARRLVERGVATRLKPGLFTLVPFELGHERDYMGDPYIVASKIAEGSECFLSHASAMDIHQMVTQPQLIVYTTTTRTIRPQFIRGTEFRFVHCRPENMFGMTDHWIAKTRTVRISNRERTVIDGLRQSEYCGGFSEVAKGFWMQREQIDIQKLMVYAYRLDIGAVSRRLGYLLELFDINAPEEIDSLRQKLTASYSLLDPMLPGEGKFTARWRLRLNVTPDEIQSILET